MKNNIFTLPCAALVTCLTTAMQAQTLFLENFETSPVTSILNFGETQLAEGPSPCGKATRGTASDFNSSSVNFNASQNSTFFLGVNPQVLCGGFYDATLTSIALDLSGQDSLRFKCRYFKSSTLGWGGDIFNISFTNGMSGFNINNQAVFTVSNAWTLVDIALPSFLIAPNVVFTILMGGGEGTALDDIEIYNVSNSAGFKPDDNGDDEDIISLYPNPFTSEALLRSGNTFNNATLIVYNSYGQAIREIRNIGGQTFVLQRNHLPSGLYLFRLMEGNQVIAADKFVITD